MTLIDVLQGLNYSTRWYSGRNMYGKHCLAVEVENSDSLQKLMSELLEHVADNPEDSAALSKAVRNMCTDRLGKSEVIYFPTESADDVTDVYLEKKEGA